MKTDFDIVIIGSGAGGAPIAYEMAKAGKSVLVLEKGPLIRPQYQCANQRSSFRRDELISDGLEKRLTLSGRTFTARRTGRIERRSKATRHRSLVEERNFMGVFPCGILLWISGCSRLIPAVHPCLATPAMT